MFGSDGPLRLAFLTVGDRRIAAGPMFKTADRYLYYNAGVDPDARDLSPGVVLVAEYVRRALDEGVRRFDFLRGDESYKYEWGAVDEPIQRHPRPARRDEGDGLMGAPAGWDPCFTPIDRKRSAGRERIRVVEVLATGTNGGAQEHVFGLMTRLDPARFDASHRRPFGRERGSQARAGRVPGHASSTSTTTPRRSRPSRPTSLAFGPTSSTPTCIAPTSSPRRPPSR